jgi:hypothetical protein
LSSGSPISEEAEGATKMMKRLHEAHFNLLEGEKL